MTKVWTCTAGHLGISVFSGDPCDLCERSQAASRAFTAVHGDGPTASARAADAVLDYHEAHDAATVQLDQGAPDRTARRSDPVEDERARRIARIKALTYRRSELNLITPPGWLIEGVVNRASLTLLSGKFGTYKSFVSINLAASVATGVPFLGHHVAETGPVIYIAAEGASGIKARLEAWEEAHNGGVPIPDDQFVTIGGPIKLLNGDDIAGLEDLCKEIGPKLVVWDTLHRCAPGLDEDKSREAGLAIDVLSALRENYDCTQLVDHHTGHGGQRSRGSSAWEDDFDGSWVIKLAGDGEDRSPTNQRTLEHRKVKDGELSSKIPIGLVQACGSAYVDQMTVMPEEQAKEWLAVEAYAQRLDLAGVPLTYGRDRIAKALQGLGVTVPLDHNLCSDIARKRKAADYTPWTKTSVDV